MFATDYPHIEGGPDPVERFLAMSKDLGDEAIEHLFVTNASALLPA